VTSSIPSRADLKGSKDIAIDPDIINDLLQTFAKAISKKIKAANLLSRARVRSSVTQKRTLSDVSKITVFETTRTPYFTCARMIAWCRGLVQMCRAPTCAVSSDVALLMAFSNNGERDALSLRQDV
jgi:hypothetical protein